MQPIRVIDVLDIILTLHTSEFYDLFETRLHVILPVKRPVKRRRPGKYCIAKDVPKRPIEGNIFCYLRIISLRASLNIPTSTVHNYGAIYIAQ